MKLFKMKFVVYSCSILILILSNCAAQGEVDYNRTLIILFYYAIKKSGDIIIDAIIMRIRAGFRGFLETPSQGGSTSIDAVLRAATVVKIKVNSQLEIFSIVNSQATISF